MKAQHRPLILVTNDDGYDAPGIGILIEIMKQFGDLLVVAPDKGQSGQSHAVTMKDPIYLKLLSEKPGISIYSCTGTSADCVKLGVNHLASRKPDFLVSGINHGTNSAISVVYSGTVSAAIEACMHGIPAIAFSYRDHRNNSDLSIGNEWVPVIFQNLLQKGLPTGICLNVNFPFGNATTVKGIRVCRQARSAWIEKFDNRISPRGQEYFWLTGDFYNYEPDAQDTDEWALNHSFISIVPTKIDFTAHEAIQNMKTWELDTQHSVNHNFATHEIKI